MECVQGLRKEQSKQRPPLTEGSTWSAIWCLSWPMLVNMTILSTSNLVEGWVAGRLGSEVQSAVGIGSQIWFFVMMLTLALSAGTTSILSRHYGARDLQSTIVAARQSLFLAAISGCLVSVGSLLAARPILDLFGASQAVTEQAWEYLKYTSVSALPYTILWISNSIFRAKGDSRTPMLTMLFVTSCTIMLDLILCLKPLQLGISGIGVSWFISSSLGIVINFFALKRSDLGDCIDWTQLCKLRIKTHWLSEFLWIGLPACMQDISLVLGSFGIFFILGHCASPISSQAAWSAGWRIEETLTIMPMYALNMAAATIVGQNIGAQKLWRAKICGWQIMLLALIINTFVAITLYFAATPIAAFMTDNSDVQALCAHYLKTVSWTEPFFASWLILSGCLQGAGSTRYPMLVTIVAFDLVRIGLAWYLSIHLGMGAGGTWIAMASSTVVAAIWMIYLWTRYE